MAYASADEIVGKPIIREVWLAPDWSASQPVTKPQPKGWTRVSVSDTTYADGRIVTEVLDENRAPIKTQALEQTTDDKQAERWQQQQDDAKPPGGLPTRSINGQTMQWNPSTRAYDIPVGQAATAQTPKEKEDQRERDWHIAQGHGNVTHAEYETQQRQRAAEARATQDQNNQQSDRNKPVVKIEPNASGELVAISVYPDGHTETKPTGVKGTPQQVKGPDGNTYERQPDGSYALPRGIPDQRAPYTGPKLPQIVLGHSAEALQALGDQLARDPSLTPAQREKMWGEAIQTANVAVAEAGVLQRERESNLNAQVNLATTRQKAEADAFTTALKYATDLNDKLPAGSPLGGQAFAAMLGMQMISAHRSGLYDIKPPGTPVSDAAARPAPAPAPTLVNPGNRAAVEAQWQEVAAQTAQVAQQRSAPAAAPAAPNYRPGATTDPANTPMAPASAGMPPAPPSAVPASAGLPDPTYDGATYDPSVTNGYSGVEPQATGAPISTTVGAEPTGAALPLPTPGTLPQPTDSLPSPAATPDPLDQEIVVRHFLGQEIPVTRREFNSWPPFKKQQYTEVGPAATTYTQAPAPAPAVQAPQSMAPPSPASEFAALAPYMPPQQPVAPQAGPSVDMSQSPALLHAQAASVPPWRLSAAQISQMQAAGIPDSTIFSVPGMPQQRQVA